MSFQDYRYIFIVTYARSGSTLLQSLLNTAQGVLIRGENNNAAFHLYRAIDAVQRTWKRGKNPETAERDHPWFGAGDVRPQRLRNRLLNSLVEEVLTPPEGVSVIGFKEVRHIPEFMTDAQFHGYMDFLLTAFPGARILCNSRDADAVANSGFLKARNERGVQNWVRATDARFEALCARSDRCRRMKLEEFTEDHEKLREMFEFLELPYDAAAVQSVLDKPLTHAKGTPG